jgi:phenylpyruvate tautomerase PptA (4-oxalocrotonate tautomerase family)
MSHYKCIICKYKTADISNYNRHNLSKRHIEKINNSYSCEDCDYITPIKVNYTRHLLSKKHLENKDIIKDKKQNIDVDDKNEQLKKIISEVKNELKEELKEESKETIKVLMNKMNLLENKNDQNTNKIVKEARNVKCSMLTILNTHFKDTPSIEYIKQEPFLEAFEEEYKAKISEDSDKLFMRIFTDYEKKKLVKTLSDLILKFVQKDDASNFLIPLVLKNLVACVTYNI